MSSLGSGVGVVLVEYHSAGLVADRAAEALRAGHAVVVADNSSTYIGPGSRVEVARNVGFGAGCNRAVSHLPPEIDVIVLQNPDATIEPSDLERLVACVRSGWAVVAPSLMTHEHRPYGFAVPTPRRELALVLLDLVRIRRRPSRGDASPPGPRSSANDTNEPVSMEGRFGSAAFLAMSRSWYERVGGFDERYFLYVEDLDLWTRIERSGGRVGFLPEVVVFHDSSTGSAASSVRRTLLRWLGRELWVAGADNDWRRMRRLHRLAVRLMSLEGDDVSALAAEGLQTDDEPGEVLRRIRLLCEGVGEGRKP